MERVGKGAIGALVALGVGLGSAAAWSAHHEGKGAGHGGHGAERHKRHFERRDADGDGQISKAEWMAGVEEHFTTMDADGDETITMEEWTAGHAAMRKRWKQHHGEKH